MNVTSRASARLMYVAICLSLLLCVVVDNDSSFTHAGEASIVAAYLFLLASALLSLIFLSAICAFHALAGAAHSGSLGLPRHGELLTLISVSALGYFQWFVLLPRLLQCECR